MEGHWETQRGAPLILFGMPDMERRRPLAVEIPYLGSLILRHMPGRRDPGPEGLPARHRPTNVPLVFWAFRIMVGLGVLMIALGFVSLCLRWRGRLYDSALVPALGGGHGAGRADRGDLPAGSPRKRAGSPSPSMACCAPPTASPDRRAGRRHLAGRCSSSVYFVVFGAGIWYLFRLFAPSARARRDRARRSEPPIRTAGITPAPAGRPRPRRTGAAAAGGVTAMSARPRH